MIYRISNMNKTNCYLITNPFACKYLFLLINSSTFGLTQKFGLNNFPDHSTFAFFETDFMRFTKVSNNKALSYEVVSRVSELS